MSDQNSTTPDPSEAVPGYQPPVTPEPASPAEPPAYTPPTAPPPAAPPSQEPSGYPPPATGGYEPPPPGAYQPPPASGYSAPPSGYGENFQDPGAYGTATGPLAPVGGAPLADWPKRALGGLIDYVAAGVVIAIVGSILSNVSSGLGTTVQYLLGLGWSYLYLGYKSGTTGVTIGRSIAKTKLISEATGQPIGVGMGILRQFAHIIDGIICGIGWLFPLWDAKKQTIADKLVKTVVIDNSADPDASKYNWN